MDETLKITKAQLHAAYFRWETENREGLCLSEEATRQLTVEEVAEKSVRTLLEYLAPLESTT